MTTLTADHPSESTESIVNIDQISPHVFEASSLLKALGHQGRLSVLCHLGTGEKTVKELQHLTNASQAITSSNLARLRYEGLVTFRKEGKSCKYFLKNNKARQVLGLVNDIFCEGLATGRT